MHLFGRNRDHDYYFGLLSEEEPDAQSAAEGGTGAQRSKRAGATPFAYPVLAFFRIGMSASFQRARKSCLSLIARYQSLNRGVVKPRSYKSPNNLHSSVYRVSKTSAAGPLT